MASEVGQERRDPADVAFLRSHRRKSSYNRDYSPLSRHVAVRRRVLRFPFKIRIAIPYS